MSVAILDLVEHGTSPAESAESVTGASSGEVRQTGADSAASGELTAATAATSSSQPNSWLSPS
jgi:hypothetical protein